MASQAKKADEPSSTESKQHLPAFDPGQIDVALTMAPCCLLRHGDLEWFQDGSERKGIASDATKHSVGSNENHDEAQDDTEQKDCKKAGLEEQLDECGEVFPQIQGNELQNQWTGDVSSTTDPVHRRLVTQPASVDGEADVSSTIDPVHRRVVTQPASVDGEADVSSTIDPVHRRVVTQPASVDGEADVSSTIDPVHRRVVTQPASVDGEADVSSTIDPVHRRVVTQPASVDGEADVSSTIDPVHRRLVTQPASVDGEADVSSTIDPVHRRVVTQPASVDGDEPGCVYYPAGESTKTGALSGPSDYSTEIKEIKQLLTVLFDEIRNAQTNTPLSINQALASHQSDCRLYTDHQVRSLDCRLHGLSAVLDHVQTRCMEAELARETFRESETLSSSDTQDDVSDDNAKTKAGLPATVHQEENRSWLRQNHLTLVNNLDLKNGLLIDRLVQDDVLFQSDEETIRSHPTRKCQVRELVSRINRCDSDGFMKFKNHVMAEYPHLNCLPPTEKKETKKRENCVVCNLTDIVDVRDIVDHLYQQKCIDPCTYEAVWRNDSSEKGWCRLLEGMAGNDSKCTAAMVAALSRKYPGLSRDVACAEGGVLACCCSKKTH